MTLPKIEHPLFTVIIPSTKKQIKLRPMLVKEEKILLMAKEGSDNNAIMLAVKQVVNNCMVDNKINIDNLALFDIDYLFLQIRSNSIDSTIKVSFEDRDDNNKAHEYIVDLNEVVVKFPDEPNMTIAIGKDKAIKLKYPTAATWSSPAIANAKTAQELVEELLFHCFDAYVEGDKVYKFSECTRAEATEFIDNMPIAAHNKVFKFFETMPHLNYDLKYKNSAGDEKKLTLKKLDDFFTF